MTESRQTIDDLSIEARWELLQEVVNAARRPGQPEALFAAMDHALGLVAGHKLFTLMRLHRDTHEAERIYSSNPVAYPVSGRKQWAETPWSKQVILAKQHYLGSTDADIRWGFPDHELIKQLGCGSIINLLVIYNDEVLGTANLLHEEHHYREQDITACLPFVQLLATAFIA